MSKVVNNLLVLLIFLSPIVSGLDLSDCHSKEQVAIEKADCHGSSEQPVSSFICDDCCDGFCSDCSIHNYVDNNIPFVYPVSVSPNPLLFIYSESIPFLGFLPPFRPPIA